MLRNLFTAFLFLLTACASTSPAYFSETAWDIYVEESYFHDQASAALKLMHEPSLIAPDAPPAFRVLLLTGVTPVHAIRVTPQESGRAEVVLTRLDGGYRMKGRRSQDSRYRHIASKEDYAAFLAVLESKPLFYQKAMPNLEDYHMCLHPSVYVYELQPNNDYALIRENGCAFTEEGKDVMRAFYSIANLTAEKDGEWSLVDW